MDWRFPRPCRLVARRFFFARQIGVGEAFANDLRHSQAEALRVGNFPGAVFTMLVSENLFVNVACKVSRFTSGTIVARTFRRSRSRIPCTMVLPPCCPPNC